MKQPVLQIVAQGGIGDTLLLTPSIREWRRQNPAGKLTVYCPQEFHRQVLLGNPHIDSLRLIGSWRRRLFAAAPLLERRFRARVAIPHCSTLLPSVSYRIPAARIIAEMVGVELKSTALELHLSDAETSKARQRLAGLATPVALHTTPASTPNKLWTTENWEELVRESPEYAFVQLGTRDEPLVPGAADLRGLSLRESFASIKYCFALVGPDSGLAHAAAAVSVPAVVLFGASNPEVWGHPGAINIYTKRSCSPCIDILRLGQCPYDRACMRAIRVQDVSRALRELLAARPVAA